MTLDALGQRYGQWPSAFLRLSIIEMNVVMLAAQAGLAAEERKRDEAELRRRGYG